MPSCRQRGYQVLGLSALGEKAEGWAREKGLGDERGYWGETRDKTQDGAFLCIGVLSLFASSREGRGAVGKSGRRGGGWESVEGEGEGCGKSGGRGGAGGKVEGGKG